MPPIVSRKRLREEDKDTKAPGRRKPTLYDSLDAGASHGEAESPLVALTKKSGKAEDESDLSSLSDEDEDDDDDAFEDVPLAKRAKTDADVADEDEDEEDSDDDMVFEDVPAPLPDFDMGPAPTGDLELTLRKDPRISMLNSEKKGPTKRARRARILTHCMHVQFLLWHNTVRNAWLCDTEVQAIMISHIPPRIWDEIDRWRLASGLDKPPQKPGRRTGKAKGKAKMTPAEEVLEQVAADPGRDPLIRLMQTLVGWWKQRFQISQPGLRKRGYMELQRLDKLDKGWASCRTDSARFGERIENLEAFRECAQKLEGSRDVGAQLFTALVRGLGMEARMVANLQPLGFGWNRLEEADPEKEEDAKKAVDAPVAAPERTKPKPKPKPKKEPEPTQGKRNPSRQTKAQKIIADSEAESDNDDDLAMEVDDSDDASVMDVDLTAPKSKSLNPKQKYDADLEFPIYWTEVLSPITNKYMPVDATVKKVVGSTRELTELLEPRGSKADKARQVMAYVIGHAADGTAKDVTVRYLRKRVFPGRTKGFRMAVEKIATRNRHGKIKRYDHFDWLAKVMACFARGGGGGCRSGSRWTITEADLLEDAEDLTPAVPEKKEVKEGDETLAYFKASTELVLERHLKREEALLPDAEPVRMFATKVKGQANIEPVYRRVDVVQVKSAETWHKQGRAPIQGEFPLKRVPYRAATTNRRRELAEAEAATGQKMLQGLYSLEQTDWIIPDPIQNGVIPKNEYGNIDLFAAHMCPEGAVHIPYRGAMRACKKLGYDYAEAVVDFEFGHRMAVPVIHGVVCAEEHYDAVLEQIHADEAERQRKEDEKRQKAALAMWRKFLKGLRIVEQVNRDYGSKFVGFQVFGRNHRRPEEVQRELEERSRHMQAMAGGMAGGFIPEGFEADEDDKAHEHEHGRPQAQMQTSSFFPVIDEEDDDDGGLVVEDEGVQSEPQPEVSAPEREILDSEEDLSDPPQEIADSDADSDFEAPPEPPRRATRRSTRKR